MKKNILAIIILAATLVNITLTALMLFTVVPKAQRTDELIGKILTVLNLELEDPNAKDYSEVPLANRQTYTIDVSTVQLQMEEGQSKPAYAANVKVILMINTKSEGYSTNIASLESQLEGVKASISNVIGGYTATEVRNDKDKVCKAILADLQSYFKSREFIYDLSMNLIVSN